MDGGGAGPGGPGGHDQDPLGRRAQTAGGRGDLFRADPGQQRGVLGEEFGASEQQLQTAEGAAARIRLGVLAVVPGDEAPHGLRQRPPEVGRVRPVRPPLGQRRHRVPRCAGRRYEGGDDQEIGIRGVERSEDPAAGRHRLEARQTVLADHVRQHGMGQVARQVLPGVGQPVAERDGRGGHSGLGARLPPVRDEAGLPQLRRGGERAGRYVTEVPLDQRQQLFGGVVTDHGEDRVAGCVVGVEELLARGDGGVAQLRHPAVAVVRVGEAVEDHAGEQRPRQSPVRPVRHRLADLLLDAVELFGQRLLGEHRRPHPVGLAEQRALQGRRRDELVVVGVVLVRGAVGPTAQRVDVREETVRRQARAAAEHQMLEEMGEPLPFGPLGPVPDAVVDADRGTRRVRPALENHPQAVAEGRLVHLACRHGTPRG